MNDRPIFAPPKTLAKPPLAQKPGLLSKPPLFHPGASPKSPEEHMARRHQAGQSIRQIAADFNTSKSTVGRKLTSTTKD